ncbi:MULTISPECIES: asparaginase [Paenibacillus]|uniref:asparaginase n=1 Tax=Paenibacillus campinasensis TaxID=66347 RepID=A0A268EYI4_9BACL|nr:MULTISPECIES: asparaginase [Paenibacillus]MUG65335.1 asparaginase [Paenibacillus campinasensis]PAD78179.1 L-asparaginase [Paenibacillus campinasensis]PAK48480.1 L-asparaginase [Paenibacillus sp. 7541]
MKKSTKHPLAVWSTAALAALMISVSPVGAYTAQAATVTEVKGTATVVAPPAPAGPVRNTTIPPLLDAFKQSQRPNVLVIGTGGTIAGQSTDATSFQTYRAGTLAIEDMVNELPDKDKMADVSTLQFGNAGSGSYTFNDLYDLSLTVDKALEVYDSVVVTTGTDTMEEIAYFLDLTVQSDKPVVITGAMRPWTVVGSDAQANLYNAIKLAASGRTESFGTVLMLNDTIHPARGVTKTDANRMDTFQTPMLGAIGYVDEKTIRIYRAPKRVTLPEGEGKPVFDLSKISKEDLAKVEIAVSYQEAGGGAIRGFVADGAQGIVTAGTGAGGISRDMSAARREAIEKGVIFVSTTRTGSGSVYSSGEGIISGDNLSPQQARVLLLLSLSFTKDFDTIKGWFETYGTPEV